MRTIVQLYMEKQSIAIRPDNTPKPINSFAEYSKIMEQLAKKRAEQIAAGGEAAAGDFMAKAQREAARGRAIKSIPRALLFAGAVGAITLGSLAGGAHLLAARRRRTKEQAGQSKLARHRYKTPVLNNKYKVNIPDNDDSGNTLAGNEPGAGPGGGTIAAAPSGSGGPSGGVGGGAAGVTASGISGSAGGIAPARIGPQPASL